ncbi:MAG: macro domain-containing protein [Kofleriaceae bacterium]
MVELASGNLLDARVDALVNPVNTVGVMGKGLALQFKRAFPRNFAAYTAACKRGEVAIGRMFVFEEDTPRFIINFPTKQHWRDPSELAYVRDGLLALVGEISQRAITSIAVPALGCGLGGLDWTEVERLIRDAFSALPTVKALVFAPV